MKEILNKLIGLKRLNTRNNTILATITVVLLTGCAVYPDGPTVMVLPGSESSFEKFNQDDILCRNFAFSRIGPKDGTDPAVHNAVVGTIVGAGLGALMGDSSAATRVGAGLGLIVGADRGGGSHWSAKRNKQRMFNNSYLQCMYSRGHKIPVNSNLYQSDFQQGTSISPIEPPRGGTPPTPPPIGSSPQS